MGWSNNATPSQGFRFVSENSTDNVYISVSDAGGTKYVNLASKKLRNKWSHVVFTHTQGSQKIYLNGELADSDTATMVNAVGQTLTIGRNSYVALEYFKGNVSGLVWQNTTTPWTQQQITDLYRSGTIPQGATAIYKLDEGAGSTAYDSSGNGNNGTITNGTYTSDVPTKKRGVVGGNLVYNGDFEYAPPFVAAANFSGRWIDGTAGGSATNNLFGWYNNGAAADSTLQFSVEDGYKCVKGVKAAGGVLEMRQYNNYYGKNTPVLPSTSYTMSCKVKIANASGSATTGLTLVTYLTAGDGSTAAGSFGTTGGLFVANTDGWVGVSRTFTTGATVRFANPMIRCVCSDGAATLAMTFFVKDIQLRPTTPVTRGVVS